MGSEGEPGTEAEQIQLQEVSQMLEERKVGVFSQGWWVQYA